MSTLKDLMLSCDVINEDGTFSEGDCVTGKITLLLSGETRIESLFIKATGDAHVEFGHDKYEGNKKSRRRFFKLKEFMIGNTSGVNALPAGTHVYPFSLHIPHGSMPSSYKSPSFKFPSGKIVYKLEAKLTRRQRMDRIADLKLNFVSKSNDDYIGSLMAPQVAAMKNEEINMDVHVERMGYAPGETVHIRAIINNQSFDNVEPKFKLTKEVEFRVPEKSSSKVEKETVCKFSGDSIPGKTQRTVDMELKIPTNQSLSILNCEIITVEYKLKVYLGIFGLHPDPPEVQFPLVIIPVNYQSNFKPGGAMGANRSGIGGGPSCSEIPPLAPFGSHPFLSPGMDGPTNDQPYPQLPDPAALMTHSPPSSAPMYDQIHSHSKWWAACPIQKMVRNSCIVLAIIVGIFIVGEELFRRS